MTLPVTHEGLKKPATLDLFLITSIEITELKFLTHECLLSKSMIADQ